MQQKLYCYYCGHTLQQKMWEGRVRSFCSQCRIPIYENPVPATAVVVVDHFGQLLLVKRNVAPKQGYWALPGGFMELLETPETCALRELQEETGLRGTIDRLLGVVANNSDVYGTVLIVGYLITAHEGELLPGDDASDVAFFPSDELPEIAFTSHSRFINGALRHRNYT